MYSNYINYIQSINKDNIFHSFVIYSMLQIIFLKKNANFKTHEKSFVYFTN
jgi:hypothetical protein